MTTPAKTPAKATLKTKASPKAKDGISEKPKKTSKSKVAAVPKLSPIDQALQNHLIFSSFKTNDAATPRDWYDAASYTVRDHVVERWVKTAESYYRDDPKRVYYLSLEFLIGRMLSNAALNLGINDELKDGLSSLGRDLENTVEMETDAALGNGGLGRLAACFLDSMATMDIPATGYGIRYEYGMFKQTIENGLQVENPDNWLRYGNIWEFQRPEATYNIKFYGNVVKYASEGGETQHWVDAEHVVAMAYDVPVPGFGGDTVNSLRLWSAKAAREFDLSHFNDGNYEKAVQERNDTENISKVLYPNDASVLGKELRLKQQYFFVSASIQDILRRFLSTHEMKKQADWKILPDKIAIQLNDTHPSIGVAEMMYQLVDVHGLAWDFAWGLVVKVFAYTNHTLMPEALETWTVDLFGRLLPRHLEIIYKINFEFLHMVNHHFPGDPELLKRVSIIDESNGRRVRMAHLAVVGSHTVNGVAALHSELLKQHLFADFDRIYPGKMTNVTNGITPRRWLNQANPGLTALIEKAIGADFKKDLTQIKKITPLANDAEFRKAFAAVKHANKARLAAKIEQKTGIKLNVNSLFDVQIKRIHEYKRQLLNVLHVITLYNRIRSGEKGLTPRTVIFGGKAAPGYWMAKQIIRLINDVAAIVNEDVAVGDQLKVVYYPNYEVSAAEILFPGSDLSEQISTAGTEASGTGNMKMALNGALTIGTLDGANVEIMEEVGDENIFIFGLTTPQVAEVKANGYNPNDCYHSNPELKQVLDMIADGYFSIDEPNRYQPIVDNLLKNGDQYLLLADYASYIETQDRVGKLYQHQDEWTRLAILNVANMAKFSSDRAISDYAKNIWHV
ncbi:glycogen/starch/alpha-glucan phosphorylase [Methylotenera sp.]|uniref:glycogen/starch/alpha-glucan phosphorylase n=1 Tax=Methylotenera sp. TaxID=2051956 RepID=UPI0027311F7B|nr:glycogen/starch/alpha-glucan phosphorylase [Methylotenera sp.]MDP2071053.1 glycogen/starch/alpha-glucan phosphorylase [Methylotenera sp.]MDP3005927.1 glycogen/starch/alpha-glucan phosphorylase [Methylotenera sp.]